MSRYVLTRRRLYEQIVEILQEEILAGTYLPGTNLPSERELMEMFGDSRAAIREAVFALQRMGLVEVSTGVRPRVSEPRAKAMIGDLGGAARFLLSRPGGHVRFQEARLFFEVGLVRHAAQHATAADIARLREMLERNRQDIGDRDAFQESDIAFHSILAEIPRNPIFPAIQEAMSEWLIDHRTGSLSVAGQDAVAYEGHREVCEAVAAGDPDLAETAMTTHLRQVFSVYNVNQSEPVSAEADGK